MTPTPEQLAVIDAARIPLTQGLFALVDAEDLPRVLAIGKTWFAHKSRHQYYAETKVNGVAVKLHRVITYAEKDEIVDHINRNGLDNRKQNLRKGTTEDNNQNKSVYSNNKSGTPGVYFSVTARGTRYWHAQITIRGRQKLLGRFYTKEEAISARQKAEQECL